MQAFLNPIQFGRAAREAGFDARAASRMLQEASAALASLTPADVRERGVSKPLPPRVIPTAARSPLRDALERQNADRAAAVEVQIVESVFVTFCAGFIADVRVVAEAAPVPAPV